MVKKPCGIFFKNYTTLSLIVSFSFLVGSQVMATVISLQEESDLCLFTCPSSEHVALFPIVDRTITRVGQENLKNKLRTPLVDIDQLMERQHIIRELAGSPVLLEALERELLRFKNNETQFNSFRNMQDPIRVLALKEFYFKSEYLKKYNTNPAVLNTLQLFNVCNMFGPLVEHAVLHFFISNALKDKLHINCGHIHDHSHDHAHHHGHHHGPACNGHHEPSVSYATQLFYQGYNLAHLGFHILNAKALYDHLKQKGTLIKSLQEDLIGLKASIASMQAISNLISSHNLKLARLGSIKQLLALVEDKVSDADSGKLMSILQKNTFKDTASVMSNAGNVLAANVFAQNAQDVYAAAQSVGEIDAFVSLAKLYNEYKDRGCSFSFAQYQQASSPRIKADNFWNPYIADDKVYLNSLHIGLDNPTHIILTGDNGAGKSTCLKTMALIALLGQTITLVPAQAVCFTPFAKITTSIVHTDNIQAGNSLFNIEMIKAEAFIEGLAQLSEKEFSFIVCDELFKSTNAHKGKNAAYDFIHSMSKFKNNIAIISTHYGDLTKLESEDHFLFKNYIAAARQHSGKPQFTISPGHYIYS